MWILINISLKFVPKGQINNIPPLVQIMAWRRSGDKPLSESMMVILLTHIDSIRHPDLGMLYSSILYNGMMTSSNGNIFRITGPLCGEFTGHRWIPLTKASDAELWCFLWSRLNKRLSKQSWDWWVETPSRSLWRHCNDPLKTYQLGVWKTYGLRHTNHHCCSRYDRISCWISKVHVLIPQNVKTTYW